MNSNRFPVINDIDTYIPLQAYTLNLKPYYFENAMKIFIEENVEVIKENKENMKI